MATTYLDNWTCSANRRPSKQRIILWFDPRREHSSVPTASLAAAARTACQGWPRLRGHPKGLALIGRSTAARLMRPGRKHLVTLGEIQTDGSDTNSRRW